MKLEDFNEKDFNINESIKVQKELQVKKDYPYFAPGNGICWSCHNQIYAPIKNSDYVSGIATDKAKTELITGCPHCHRSYCD